ncbi:MAG: hypothetical protein BWK73_47075 [Thiothrix lacustris]|uniref:Uncharacterized protein n=1 Tax=Thiothrix lacustris TaxID=525917 RepID=A0A1Y1QAC6_9GAMM|nr:MAG: hypothetical protein BWK73_47075 [Thiothrix lacustris]
MQKHDSNSSTIMGTTYNLTPSMVVKLQVLTTDQLALAEDIIDVMISRGSHSTETQRLQVERDKLLVDLGYAMESISQLVELSIEKGHKRDVAVTTAQRFLREIKGGAL